MEQDTGWKEYFSDNRRYADLINGLGCRGRQAVTEQDLQEQDSQTGYSGGRKKDSRSEKRGNLKLRDMVRKVAFGVNFAVIGIENQEKIDYSMALRNLSYDAGEYGKQAAKIRREVRENPSGLSAGEYLYGFRKDSRLHPVVTFLLYSGVEEWDGPKSLHGMLDFTGIPGELEEMVPDYRVNLIEIRKWSDTSVFRTDVRQVFDFIRCSEDKKALAELVEQESCYREMEEDAYNVVVHYAHVEELIGKKDYYREDGKIDMCRAIREMVQDGVEQGISQGERNKTLRVIENMISHGMEDDMIMAITECDPELIREVRAH